MQLGGHRVPRMGLKELSCATSRQGGKNGSRIVFIPSGQRVVVFRAQPLVLKRQLAPERAAAPDPHQEDVCETMGSDGVPVSRRDAVQRDAAIVPSR
jgi:hypothetical protein